MTDRPLFVTGASGFIGRSVVVRLLEDGHRLLLAETTSYPSRWRNDPRIQFIGLKRLEKEKNLAKLVGNSCGIVHLAGLAHVAKGDNDNPGQRFFRLTPWQRPISLRLRCSLRPICLSTSVSYPPKFGH
ncbi:NAD-dependent epimerase/dehydratase family protein [Pseudaminobacter manganicus]|uniref:NAD-dependent epimerase/dehydratase family protein n=1 Tax=Manganibacter manganicus TaxID=1873176 RepID=UPI0009B9D151